MTFQLSDGIAVLERTLVALLCVVAFLGGPGRIARAQGIADVGPGARVLSQRRDPVSAPGEKS